MNKEELVSAIAGASKMTKKDVNVVLDATLKCISDALKQDDKVTLVGFGTFQVKARAAREGRNPKTNEVLHIPAKKVPVFTPGKGLRETISPVAVAAAAPAKKKAAPAKGKK